MEDDHQAYLERLRQRAREAIEAHVNEQFNHGVAPVFNWDLYLTENDPEQPATHNNEEGSADPFVDLLADLWHLAEHYNFDMESIVTEARSIYQRETKGDEET